MNEEVDEQNNLKVDHTLYMKMAIQEAMKAMDEGEVPVGTVIVHNNKVIAKGYNRVETTKDPTAHSEIIAIGAASDYLDNWRLEGCTLYSTLEPCPMCAGAILNARVSRVVYGAKDKRLGACGSACRLLDVGLLNRETEVISSVMEEDCAILLKAFFMEIRQRKK